MTLFKFIIIILVLVVGLTFFILNRNGANLFEAPGVAKRLGVFLSANSATTSNDHSFEELRTPVFDMNAKKLYNLTTETVSGLGWGVVSHDSDKLNVNFVVSSPVFLFEDDVFVQVNDMGAQRSSLDIKSKSRSGRADFAANSGHIQKLISSIKEKGLNELN